MNRLTNVRTAARVGDVTVASYAYTLGPTGIRTRIDEADGTTRSYEYDELYRLTKETVSGEQSYEKTFAYDQVSNRLSQTRSADAADAGAPNGNGGTINYTYDNRDRLIGEDSTVYSWSANGNLVGRTGDGTFEWDFEDRLVKVVKADGTVVENVYDVDGVLVRTAVNGVGTDYLVDTSGGLSHVVAEVDSSGAVAVLYVRAGDMLLEEIRGGVAKMYEADGLGSVRGLLDTSGATTDTWSYTAFGETLSSTGTDQNPYRFAGERWSDSTGFYQNRARWLDTRTGRFVSVDPANGKLRLPVTFQPYLYGGGSPVSYVDPTGRDTVVSVAVTLAVSGIIAAGAYMHANYAANAMRVSGVPKETLAEMSKYEEIRIVWGDPDFDRGVANLIRYWWKNTEEHDVWEALVTAAEFRNRSYGISQDIRVCAAERYLTGLNQSKLWGKQQYGLGEVGGYENLKRLHPWFAPGTGYYPPSPYSGKARGWYEDGLFGFGGQQDGIVPSVGCWNYWSEEHNRGDGEYRNFENAGPVNGNCK